MHPSDIERNGMKQTRGGAMLKRRVMLVEDHPIFRRGLRRFLEESGRYAVVAEASTGYEAIRLADIESPELVIMDVQLAGVTGLQVARVLLKHRPGLPIIFLSMHVDDSRLLDAIRVGARAFLTKDCDVDTLLRAVGRALNGENLINELVMSTPSLARRMLEEFRSGNAERGVMPLSSRELEVLDCVAQGLSNKEIAETLYVTEQTVKNHMTAVLKKLDVDDRVQALLFGVRNGWIEIGPQPYTAVAVPQSA
jgi:DNA-binding NarL/FixJ family response regulator